VLLGVTEEGTSMVPTLEEEEVLGVVPEWVGI